jgi:hypothetical protein
LGRVEQKTILLVFLWSVVDLGSGGTEDYIIGIFAASLLDMHASLQSKNTDLIDSQNQDNVSVWSHIFNLGQLFQ